MEKTLRIFHSECKGKDRDELEGNTYGGQKQIQYADTYDFQGREKDKLNRNYHAVRCLHDLLGKGAKVITMPLLE